MSLPLVRTTDQRIERETTRLARGLYESVTLGAIGNLLASGISRLIAHDGVILCEGNKSSGRTIYHAQTIGAEFQNYEPAIERFFHQIPFIPHYAAHPNSAATRTFDLMTPSAWRNSGIFNEALSFLNIGEQLGCEVPSGPQMVRGFLLNRLKSGFQSRDVRVLELLRPHIASASAIAEQWRRSDTGAPGPRRRASIHLDAGGRVTLHSPEAVALLVAHCGPFSGALPQRVGQWADQEVRQYGRSDLWATPRTALRIAGPHSVITSRLTTGPAGRFHIILVEEIRNGSKSAALPSVPRSELDAIADLGLTRREAEVLRWVAEGKTNGETAIILGLSPATVKTHLERIYGKLGVEGRHAASRLVFERVLRDPIPLP